MRTVLLLGLLVVACKARKDEEHARGACLELPNKPRRMLRVDPNGDGLYWIETVVTRDYDGVDKSFERLVRYDLTANRLDVLHEPVDGMLHFAKDGSPLVVAHHDNNGVFELIRGGLIQGLVPTYFDVKEVEHIVGNRFAMRVGADSKWSIYTLDLDRPRPVHLVDATGLLGATREAVYVRDGDDYFAVDLTTGAKSKIDVPVGMADGEYLYFTEDSFVKARSLRTGATTTLVREPGTWTFAHQYGAVLARAGLPRQDQHAYLLVDGAATQLPVIGGGASLVGAAWQGKTLWGLVGHNTSNYDGDLYTAVHEADVCRLDIARTRLTFTGRTLPARYADKSTAFWAAAAKYPNTLWQVLDSVGDPPTVYIEMNEDGGGDLEKLRARARELHKSVTSILDDDEVRTSLSFLDGRVASYRWRRERLRGRSLAGIGDVALTDPGDFDVELADIVDVKVDDEDNPHIRCSGKVTNLRAVTMLDVEVRCMAGDVDRVIRIPKLEPKQTFPFSETYPLQKNDNPIVEVYRGRELLVVRDMAWETSMRGLYDFFVAVHADTDLALYDHDTKDQFKVVLAARRDATVAQVDTAKVKQAYERVNREARRLLDVGQTELDFQILVNRVFHRWDGEKLVPVN